MTLILLEETTDDEDEMVVLVMLGVAIMFSVCEAASREVLLISAAELDEDTSSDVTARSGKLLEIAMVEENEAVETNERREPVTVMTTEADASLGGVLVGVTIFSEIGYVVVGVSVVV